MLTKYELIFTFDNNKKLYWTGKNFSALKWEAKHYVSAKSAIKLLNQSQKFRQDNGCVPLFREVIKSGCTQLVIAYGLDHD